MRNPLTSEPFLPPRLGSRLESIGQAAVFAINRPQAIKTPALRPEAACHFLKYIGQAAAFVIVADLVESHKTPALCSIAACQQCIHGELNFAIGFDLVVLQNSEDILTVLRLCLIFLGCFSRCRQRRRLGVDSAGF
jgi:hypothetical protein